MENEQFAELIAALRAGDEQAAEELLHRYEAYIRRVVRMRLHDSNLTRLFDSMDICQSILFSFLRHARAGEFELGGPEQLRNLLVTMALNKLMTKARTGRREAGNLPEGWDAADPAPAPAEHVATADLAAAVRERLSPAERDLFQQHDVEGRTWEEIARLRGERPDALRLRLTRALARVRGQLAKEG